MATNTISTPYAATHGGTQCGVAPGSAASHHTTRTRYLTALSIRKFLDCAPVQSTGVSHSRSAAFHAWRMDCESVWRTKFCSARAGRSPA